MNLTKPFFDEQEMTFLKECLDSGWVTQGPMVKKFEELFAIKQKTKYALATSSCTTALHLAMMALGIGTGDEVIVPAFTWVTSANCAEYMGAKAVFADVDVDSFNINPESFAAAITPKTKAVVVVHLFGLSAMMGEIMNIASKKGICVVEDAACAVGTEYDSYPVGAIGDVGCFSFHPRKIITTGEGGMLTTNNPDLNEKVRCLRNHGASLPKNTEEVMYYRPYQMDDFNILGYNFRLSDIQASVGIAQMKKLESFLKERRMLADSYSRLLAEVEEIILPAAPERCGHTYQSYVIRVKDGRKETRNAYMDAIYKQGIQTRPGTHAVHRLGYYRTKYGLRPEQFPNAVICEDTSITLPLYPGMMLSEQEYVVDALKGAISGCTK